MVICSAKKQFFAGVKLGLIKRRDDEDANLTLSLNFLNYFKWILPTKVLRIASLIRFAEGEIRKTRGCVR